MIRICDHNTDDGYNKACCNCGQYQSIVALKKDKEGILHSICELCNKGG